MKKYRILAMGTAFTLTTFFAPSAFAEKEVQDASTIHSKIAFGAVERIYGAIAVKENIDRTNTRKETTSKASLTVEQERVATYTVVKGDTLSKIAQNFGVTIKDIMSWNQLSSPNVIFIGQTLKIYGSLDSALPVSGGGESSNEEVHQDELLKKEQEIQAKLSKETKITRPPTENGQKIYKEALNIASQQLGVPYLFAGNTPDGFDCSGFIRYVFVHAGFDLPRKSSEDYFMNDSTVVEQPVPGDLIYFKNTYKAGISHMGIYLGNGQFIHAGSDGVAISNVEYDYWKSRFVAYKRFNGI